MRRYAFEVVGNRYHDGKGYHYLKLNSICVNCSEEYIDSSSLRSCYDVVGLDMDTNDMIIQRVLKKDLRRISPQTIDSLDIETIIKGGKI